MRRVHKRACLAVDHTPGLPSDNELDTHATSSQSVLVATSYSKGLFFILVVNQRKNLVRAF